MSLDLTISIVTYQEDPEKLNRAIASVLGSDLNLRLYLVDNSPDAGLRDSLPCDPRIEYLHFPENLGFGKAHNTAIRLAGQGAACHLVLNPDVEFLPAILHGMIEFLREHPGVGLLGPRVSYPTGELQPLCKLLPTPVDVFLRRFARWLPLFRRRNQLYELADKAYGRVCRVPSLSGCFMLFRTSSLWEAGLFDERFFMYFEDVDLCRRIAITSDTLFVPQFNITHAYQKGSYRSSHLLKIHLASAFRYFTKWGWIFDASRRRINRETLAQFGDL